MTDIQKRKIKQIINGLIVMVCLNTRSEGWTPASILDLYNDKETDEIIKQIEVCLIQDN